MWCTIPYNHNVKTTMITDHDLSVVSRGMKAIG